MLSLVKGGDFITSSFPQTPLLLVRHNKRSWLLSWLLRPANLIQNVSWLFQSSSCFYFELICQLLCLLTGWLGGSNKARCESTFSARLTVGTSTSIITFAHFQPRLENMSSLRCLSSPVVILLDCPRAV